MCGSSSGEVLPQGSAEILGEHLSRSSTRRSVKNKNRNMQRVRKQIEEGQKIPLQIKKAMELYRERDDNVMHSMLGWLYGVRVELQE